MRISGITLPDNKRLVYGLTAVYGIGLPLGKTISKTVNIDPMKFIKDLTEEEQGKIRQFIEDNYLIEGDLRREKSQNIKRLKDVQSYRGTRHARGLPVRGQRTKTNSRTVRGNKRVTMGSGRTKVEKT